MKRSKKHTPFCKRSKRKRREQGICVSNDIAQDRYRFQGRFTSYYPMIDPVRSDPEVCNECGTSAFCAIDPRMCGNSQSFEFRFLGGPKWEVWFAEIVTARREFWDLVNDVACNRAWNMLAPEDQEPFALYGVLGHSLNRPSYLNGLTFHEYCKQIEREVLQNEPPEIYEGAKVDYSNTWGYDLKIVLDIERITLPVVINAIDRFFETGKQPWRSDKPVARERLPLQTEGDNAHALHAQMPKKECDK